MPREDGHFTSETGKAAGRKSKRGQSISSLLEKFSNATVKGEKFNGKPITYKEKIILRLITKAAQDEEHLGWIKEYLDREEGKAQQKIEHSGEMSIPQLVCTEEQKAFIEGE